MTTQPLAGLRVIEFSQMVMGPCCGLILADLGAEVIKVEPLPRGDRTRYLPGLAAGFFAAFNRNKKSVAVDMKSERGLGLVKRLIAHERHRDRELQARHDGGLRARLCVARRSSTSG